MLKKTLKIGFSFFAIDNGTAQGELLGATARRAATAAVPWPLKLAWQCSILTPDVTSQRRHLNHSQLHSLASFLANIRAVSTDQEPRWTTNQVVRSWRRECGASLILFRGLRLLFEVESIRVTSEEKLARRYGSSLRERFGVCLDKTIFLADFSKRRTNLR